jgi:hypothetical protein
MLTIGSAATIWPASTGLISVWSVISFPPKEVPNSGYAVTERHNLVWFRVWTALCVFSDKFAPSLEAHRAGTFQNHFARNVVLIRLRFGAAHVFLNGYAWPGVHGVSGKNAHGVTSRKAIRMSATNPAAMRDSRWIFMLQTPGDKCG